MTQVAIWTLVAGFVVFLLGLISAVGARNQRASKAKLDLQASGRIVGRSRTLDAAMNMAASGSGNIHVDNEENLASVGHNSR